MSLLIIATSPGRIIIMKDIPQPITTYIAECPVCSAVFSASDYPSGEFVRASEAFAHHYVTAHGTIEQKFAHVPESAKHACVTRFVECNPALRGIDFYTMMEMVLDADAHLPLIGDVELTPENCTRLVDALGR